MGIFIAVSIAFLIVAVVSAIAWLVASTGGDRSSGGR